MFRRYRAHLFSLRFRVRPATGSDAVCSRPPCRWFTAVPVATRWFWAIVNVYVHSVPQYLEKYPVRDSPNVPQAWPFRPFWCLQLLTVNRRSQDYIAVGSLQVDDGSKF